MARRCDITGIGPISGNHVSHANNKTKRVFNPNLHTKRFYVPLLKRIVRLTISAKGLRMIDKKGIDFFAQALVKQGL